MKKEKTMSKIRGNHRYRTRNSRKNLISAQYDTIQKVFLICFPLPYTNKVKIRCYYYDDYKKRGLLFVYSIICPSQPVTMYKPLSVYTVYDYQLKNFRIHPITD
jgi:hypothetical protein